jgi:hypothetical protein
MKLHGDVRLIDYKKPEICFPFFLSLSLPRAAVANLNKRQTGYYPTIKVQYSVSEGQATPSMKQIKKAVTAAYQCRTSIRIIQDQRSFVPATRR